MNEKTNVTKTRLNAFGFKLTADDFKGVDTFEDFYNMIEKHLHQFNQKQENA